MWPTSGSAATTSWKYQGRLDLSPSAIPLYAAGARDYAPGLGMFTSLDTFAGSAQDPLSMNRFLYAEANPATLVDPSGHAGCPAGKKCAAGDTLIIPAAAGQPTIVRHAAGSSGGASPGSTPSLTESVTIRPNGIIVGADGAMVDPTQYEHYASACQMAGRPGPEFAGGVCDAWWLAEDKIFASQQSGSNTETSGMWASVMTLDVAKDFLNEYGDKLRGQASVNLNISKVLTDTGADGAGAAYQLSIFDSESGNLLKLGSNGVLAVGLALNAVDAAATQAERDRGKNLDPGTEVLRMGGRVGVTTVGGVGGGWVAVLLFGGGCEAITSGIGTPACLALLAGTGGIFGQAAGNAATDSIYGWIDTSPTWQVEWPK